MFKVACGGMRWHRYCVTHTLTGRYIFRRYWCLKKSFGLNYLSFNRWVITLHYLAHTVTV
ncbi:hypothetical protein MUJ59_004525 [Vibrio parahaemolyticus]|nr:hypothetical protein [Vibrio parahaemolyticus]